MVLNRLVFKFLYALSVITLLLFSSISCLESGAGGLYSSKVIVAMYPWRPVLNYKGEHSAVCRKGRPDNYLTPWDERRLIQGERTRTTAVDEAEEGGGGEREPKTDIIYLDGGVEDFWFWFAPLIRNGSTSHLVVNEIRVRVFQGQNEIGSPAPFMDGYCETPLLYHFAPGEQINIGHLSQVYHKGNLKFFVGGLSPSENQRQGSSIAFPRTQVREYRVEWQMKGFFADANGNQEAIFERTGSFSVQPLNF